MRQLHAEYLGRLAGRPVYRIPVSVRFNDSRQCRTVAETVVDVVSHSPADAANFVRDTVRFRPETEITAYGIKGGKTSRYVGWESATGAELFERPAPGPRLPF